MAIDQSQLLRMLLQGGGGGPSISPTSGLQDPSLSGLALGPQGMGFGGGESLMGGGLTGFGGGVGGGLGGLDLSQLLAQLQAAPGVTDAGLGTRVGSGSLGGFGAGGQIGQEPASLGPTASQQGQAGLGSAGTAAQFLSLLKEGTGLSKTLTQLFPKGTTPADLTSLTQAGVLPEFPIGAAGTSPLPGLQFTEGGNLIALPQGFTLGANLGGPQAITAPLLAGGGPESVGQVASLAPATSFLDSLGGFQGVLGGAGILGNLGFGALNLAQGNLGPGIGGILGTAGGLGLGAALAPDTAGLSLLLGGLGGGTGGFLGGLFGGGGNPRDAQRKAAEVNRNVGAAFPALQNDLQLAQTQGDVQQAIDNFTFRVSDTGFGLGFAEGHGAGLPFAGILPSPPGGQFDALVSQFQPAIAQLLKTLPSGAASRVGDFGKSTLGERAAARQAKASQQLSDVSTRTGIPPSLLTQILASGGSISGADTSDPVVWSDRGRVFTPGFGEGGG